MLACNVDNSQRIYNNTKNNSTPKPSQPCACNASRKRRIRKTSCRTNLPRKSTMHKAGKTRPKNTHSILNNRTRPQNTKILQPANHLDKQSTQLPSAQTQKILMSNRNTTNFPEKIKNKSKTNTNFIFSCIFKCSSVQQLSPANIEKHIERAAHHTSERAHLANCPKCGKNLTKPDKKIEIWLFCIEAYTCDSCGIKFKITH